MLKRIVRIFAAVYLTYLAVCLMILLPAMNVLAPRLVAQNTGRTLSSELILFNPFTLAVEMRGVALNAKTDSEPALIRFDRAQVNLSTSSLWNPGIVLDEILLHGLVVNIRQLETSDFNFSDMLADEASEDATPSEDEAPGELPAFTVRLVDFQADRLEFADETRTPAYRTYIDDLVFTVSDLSTVREAGSPFRLSVLTQHGGRLDWRGQASLATQESAGEIQLEDIDLRPAYRYFAPQLAFIVESAMLDISGRYAASWRDTPAFRLENGKLELRALNLLPEDSKSLPDTSIELDAVLINGIEINSEERRVNIEDLGIDALAVAGFSEEETHSLLPMFAGMDEAPKASGDNGAAQTAMDLESPVADDPWQLSLQHLSSTNSRLRWRSDYTTPELIHLSPVQIDLRDLSWPAQGASAVELSLRANDRSEISVAGSLDIGSGSGTLDYQLADQPLSWFNPLIAQFLRATIDEGTIQIDGNVTLTTFEPADLDLTTKVDNFALTIFGRDTSALSWRSLTVPDAKVNLQARTAAVGKVTLDGYQGSLHILPDGRLNAQMALPESDMAEDSAPTPAGDSPAENTAANTPEDSDISDWAIQAAGLQLTDARIDFEDESLPIAFHTLIEQLEGTIGSLDSTRPDKPTELVLNGSVDGYAPVTIDGEVAPFAETTALKVNARFRGVDIANLTPYSGTYAGYAIDSGTLNLDLAYSLVGDRLRGDNRMVISQMVLGEQVESERAVDLPLRLALALLTDTRGVIDLEVPITGNIESPEFSLGKIIGRALRNILTKTVTAPFRFLANLVGSGENLQEMAFAPGSAILEGDTRSKLNSLADALEQRPALSVLVRGSIDPQADVRVLQEQALEQQLLADGLTADALASRNAEWEAALRARYAAVHDDVSAGQQPEDAAPETEEPSTDAMRETVLAAIRISRQTLEALVRARAAEVKRYLVNEGGIAADRLTVSASADDGTLAGAVLDVST
ncbi:MAG: DUF748 domain-containing protein [Chromatocurvus sp.]